MVLLIDEAQDLAAGRSGADPPDLEPGDRHREADPDRADGPVRAADLLARHELRQLAQRVTARYHLAPLSSAETQAYIRHRLLVAGGEGKVGFTTTRSSPSTSCRAASRGS